MLASTIARRARVLIVCCAAAVVGCGGYYGDDQTVYPIDNVRRGANNYDTSNDSLFGPGGLGVGFGSSAPPSTAGLGGSTGVGVNSYLWRASLDTISFMPLASADPFGGVIITDWYSPENTPDERFKVNVYILARDLRSDGIRASIFKQKLEKDVWVDAAIDPETGIRLEDAILTRARELRIAQLQ